MTGSSGFKAKTSKKKNRHKFLLSYLKNDSEVFVSLFLINDRAKCINTDVAVILSQPLLTDLKALGIVPEMSYDEDLGDLTPPAVQRKETAEFATFSSVMAQTSQMYEEL